MSTLSRGYRGGKRQMSMKKRRGKSAMSMKKRGGKRAMSMKKRGGNSGLSLASPVKNDSEYAPSKVSVATIAMGMPVRKASKGLYLSLIHI